MSDIGVVLVLFWYTTRGVDIETLPQTYNMESCIAISKVLESSELYGEFEAKCIMTRGSDIKTWTEEYKKESIDNE